MIAALFVAKGGCYFDLPNVEAWDESRDARKYAGPWPVVAHPPCERWGRYWSGGPSAKTRRTLGDDGGCFEAALRAVETYGGVLEHPEASYAWRRFDIDRPRRAIGWGWIPTRSGWTCCVEQGHYGHRARKATWLYAVGVDPPELIWGPSRGERLDEGFHSKEERRCARAAGKIPIKRLSRAENIATPLAFRDVLISIAESVNQDRMRRHA